MKYKYLIVIFLLFQTISSQSQNMGDSKIIYSEILSEEREIKVVLPTDYSKEKKYPVIYITDANYNLEIVSLYLTQLANSNSIPKTILVGITQKNRGNELDVFWSKNGVRFKDFIFNEVITFIDKEYSTSGFNTIIGHSDGAEFNHLLMIEKNNPFRGFINVSENLNNDVSNKILDFFRTYKNEKLYYFIASAKYDSPDRINAGGLINSKYSESKNAKIVFENKSYRADHQNVLSKSLVDGISFVFQDYRNLDTYKNFKDYTENYKNNIENYYGFKPEENENDIDYFFGKILDNKDLEMYDYIIKYCASNNIFEILPYDRAWQYFYMDEHLKSIEYWNKSIDNGNKTSPRAFYFNFENAIDSYLVLKNPKGAIEFLEKCKTVFPQYELSFSYFIAKTALENGVEKRKGRKNLKYCVKNYTENKYFKIEDLHKLM